MFVEDEALGQFDAVGLVKEIGLEPEWIGPVFDFFVRWDPIAATPDHRFEDDEPVAHVAPVGGMGDTQPLCQFAGFEVVLVVRVLELGPARDILEKRDKRFPLLGLVRIAK